MTTKEQTKTSPKKAKVTKKATTTKRKATTAASRKKTAAQAASTATTASDAATTAVTPAIIPPSSSSASTSLPPTHILVIDNGGDTIKYGFAGDDDAPKVLPNVTARLQQQWTVLAGDQLSTIQNPNQLIGVTRSTERGIIVNLGNQIQVWKRMLDLLCVAIPLTTDTAQAFGWKQSRGEASKVENSQKIPASTCAVLLTVPPHCPRTILDQVTLIWMEDFGFSHVGFTTTQVAATYAPISPPPTINASCVVDVGWSACTVVPTYRHKATDIKAIRRLPIGGRHLINIWKYYCSYRQWNLMDQEWILRDVLEKTGYVSMNFKKEMQLARKLPPGRRPFDREFLLPDYQAIFEGEVLIPPSLQLNEDGEEDNDNEDDDDDEEDEDVREEDMNEEDVELDVGEDEDLKEEKKPKGKRKRGSTEDRNKDTGDDDDDDDDGGDEDDDDDDEDEDSEDEEDVEALRKRLLKQKEEEERRRQAIEAERQTLKVSLERFAVPEVLFRPSDADLPREWAGIAGTIFQAIEKSPEHFRPALYRSIRLIGSLAQLPNLKERLEQDLRPLVPCEYDLCVTLSPSSKIESWLGAKTLATTVAYSEWSISREEWNAVARRGSWRRLTHMEGGSVI